MEVINRDSGLSKNQLLFFYLLRQPRGYGFIKIVKTIFKADMEFFKEYRKTITRYTYEKKKNGPVPAGIRKDIDESRDFVSSLPTHEIVNRFHDNIYSIFDMDEEIPMFMYLSHRGPTEQEKIELMEKYARCV